MWAEALGNIRADVPRILRLGSMLRRERNEDVKHGGYAADLIRGRFRFSNKVRLFGTYI